MQIPRQFPSLRSKIKWNSRYLINTYSPFHKGLINIEQYPKLKKYLESHRDKLEKRHIAKKNNNNWYKLIDPVKKDLISKPKLLIPDISTKNEIIFDDGQYYPHHNFYYITSDNYENLLVLRTFLSSSFIINQVKQKGLLMNGGALRWQAQTLRKLHLPNIDVLSKEIKHKLIQLYELKNNNEINQLVNLIVKNLESEPHSTNTPRRHDNEEMNSVTVENL